MKEKKGPNINSAMPFNRITLEELKKQGYKYLQIKGYAYDHQVDYGQLRYLVLIPHKTFPEKSNNIEIYEPIDSDILVSWADSQIGVKVLVSPTVRF